MGQYYYEFYRKHGLYGGNWKASTEAEARAVYRSGSLDTAGARIVAARQAASGAIGAGGVQGSEAAPGVVHEPGEQQPLVFGATPSTPRKPYAGLQYPEGDWAAVEREETPSLLLEN